MRGGWTPLMYAARQNSLQAAQVLADGHANLNVRDPDGSTALMIAIINAHFDLANMLIEKGADLNIAEENGMTALYAAVDMNTLGAMLSRPAPKRTDDLTSADSGEDSSGSRRESQSPPEKAHHRTAPQRRRCHAGRRHHRADARGQGQRYSRHENAAGGGRKSAAHAERPYHGGDDRGFRRRNVAGMGTVRRIAGGREWLPLQPSSFCLDHGVDVNAFNSSRPDGDAHRAAARGADKVVKYLAEHGAILDMKNKQKRTPLDMAMSAAVAPAAAERARPAHETPSTASAASSIA